jgi:DNA-binding beta-propeller fold protein YncE
MKRFFFLLIWAVLIIDQNQILAQTPAFQFLEKISLPSGDGKWDYMIIDHDNLYVSHGDRIHVVNLQTNQQIGEIDSLKGVHGIAIVSSLNKGYITNGTNNAITVFDNKTFKVINTILIEGKKADAILYDNFSQRVFIFNNGSGNAIAIDVNTDKIVGKIEMGGAPEFAATNEKGSIFNNNEETHEVIEIESKTLTIKNRFSLMPSEVPTGLAIDVKHNRLFSVCRKSKTLIVLDAISGKIISTLPIGAGVDGVIYDQESHLIFTSNGEGNVTIIQQKGADSYTVIQTLITAKGQKTIVFNKKNHQIFLSGANYSADGKTPASGTFGVSVYGMTKSNFKQK